jgi:hypothetical protein
MNLKDFLYHDWFDMKNQISEVCSTAVFVGLLFGEVGFEKKILERTGMKQIFDDIFYAILKPEEVLHDIVQKYQRQQVVYIDTPYHHILSVHEQFPSFVTIAVNRERDSSDKQKTCKVDYCVKSFTEVGNCIIQNIL